MSLPPTTSLTSQATKNRFFFALRGECTPIDLAVYREYGPEAKFYEYFCRILLRLDEEYLHGPPATFYITDSWRELPSYGPDVFPILTGIGIYRVPLYTDRVGAVFKNGPLLPFTAWGSGSARLEALAAVRHLREWIFWSASYMRYLAGRPRSRWPGSKVHSIPLGYGQQVELEIDLDRPREFDLIFDGSVTPKKNHALAPKALSRSRMANAMRRLKETRPELEVGLRVTEDFASSMADNGAEYSRRMANSKVCLAPRGDVFESLRVCEALRAGCIVLCEPQPPLWFYRNSPIVEIRDWNDLERKLDEILSTPEKVRELQQRTLNHWQTVCSEDAVARFIAARIEEARAKRDDQ